MRAIVVDPSSRLGFDFADVGEPQAAEGQLLVDVSHASLNRGDVNDARSGRLAPGAVLGSGVSGVVVQMAADESGPPNGTRVVAVVSGAFAERCAAPVTALAPVPPNVDLADAAALPVAGLAAISRLCALPGWGPASACSSQARPAASGASPSSSPRTVEPTSLPRSAHWAAVPASPRRGLPR